MHGFGGTSIYHKENGFLEKWVPILAADILKGAQQEFYKAIAKITEGYVRIDRDVLVQMIDGLPLPRI